MCDVVGKYLILYYHEHVFSYICMYVYVLLCIMYDIVETNVHQNIIYIFF